MTTKEQLSKKIVDHIMLFEFDCRGRAIWVADNLKINGEARKKFLAQIRDNLPPIHLEFWQIDEMMERNGNCNVQNK